MVIFLSLLFKIFQAQILNKIKTIENVTDMLRGIIGDDESPPPSKPPSPKPEPTVTDSKDNMGKSSNKKSKKKESETDSDSSPERLKNKVMESLRRNKGLDDRKPKPTIKINSEEW